MERIRTMEKDNIKKKNEGDNIRVETSELKKLKGDVKDLNDRLTGVQSAKEFEEGRHKEEMDNIQKKLYNITQERDIAAQLVHYYSSPAPGQIPRLLGSAGVLSSPPVSLVDDEEFMK